MSHIPHTGAYAVTPDARTPGMRNGDDFIFFDYPVDFPESEYSVVVPSLTSGLDHSYLYNIGPLARRVALPPGVSFDPSGNVSVVPTYEEGMPRYFAKFFRGKTYFIRGARDLNEMARR